MSLTDYLTEGGYPLALWDTGFESHVALEWCLSKTQNSFLCD